MPYEVILAKYYSQTAFTLYPDKIVTCFQNVAQFLFLSAMVVYDKGRV